MRVYSSQVSRLRYAAPYAKIGVLGAATLLAAMTVWLLRWLVLQVPQNYFISSAAMAMTADQLHFLAAVILGVGSLLFLIAAFVFLSTPDTARIRQIIRRGLYSPLYSNPLHLKDGELLPVVRCKKRGKGTYVLTITGISKSVDDLEKIHPYLSAFLRKRLEYLAVVYVERSPSGESVTYLIEDVIKDKSLTYHSARSMRPGSPYKLTVQSGTEIDLTTSGSMLAAGKTRSGKTTGVIALLLQVLLQGRDRYGSQVLIIDPKKAELSRLPHVVTLDEDGEARTILDAIKRFAQTIRERQRVLNDLSEESGDAVHWWDAGMHPSFLFIDEYVACRSLFPKKAEKDTPDYSLAEFDNVLKRIVTMGASAGCYVIISIAQASAGEGGLPTMLRDALSTRILFKPTKEEASFIWDGKNLEAISRLPALKAGDAWFSSTDGEHDAISRVHFPYMKFQVYKELGRLLREYYSD